MACSISLFCVQTDGIGFGRGAIIFRNERKTKIPAHAGSLTGSAVTGPQIRSSNNK